MSSASFEVAVIVPCHNAAAWLPETLRSVQEQTHPAAEVVVVDDGSTDGSADVVQSMGVRCVRQEQRGPAAARNRGIRETGAPWVAFLDADDTFVEDKLARQVEHLRACGALLCCGDAWKVEGGARTGRKNEARAVPQRLTHEHLLAENPVICSTVLARRDAIESAGLFDEDPVLVATEDYDLWLRVALIDALAYLDEPLVNYRITEGQLSDDERFMHGIDRIMEKVMASPAAASDGRAGLQRRVDRRRAGVRVDLAYHLARRGRGPEARSYLRQARRLGAEWGAVWKTWLRSFAGAASASSRAPDERPQAKP